MRLELVEQGVFRDPPKMEGWRFYRIEYGGHAMECCVEGGLWAHPSVDPDYLERKLQKLVNKQKETT